MRQQSMDAKQAADRTVKFFEDGRAHGGFETGVQLALRRILASPSFAFRVEAEPDPGPDRDSRPFQALRS